MRILLISPGLHSPSGRFRVTQFAGFFRKAGHQVSIRSVFPNRFWKPKSVFQNIFLSKTRAATISRMLSVLWTLRDAEKFDVIFMNRDLVPEERVTFLEPWLSRRNPRIIFDFDDAIHLGKRGDKLKKILPSFSHVIAGNEHLEEFARKWHPKVSVWPTVVDTDRYQSPQQRMPGPLRIGWTGSADNLKAHVPILERPLRKLAEEFCFEFLIICNEAPAFKWDGVKTIYLPWSEKTEIEDVQKIDLGLMPLLDGEFEKGKCGLKAILYMALGVPALVSPVGVNQKIVTHGRSGFHCSNEEDWYGYLKLLLQDEKLRQSMGAEAREEAVKKYSIQALFPEMLKLFKETAEGRGLEKEMAS